MAVNFRSRPPTGHGPSDRPDIRPSFQFVSQPNRNKTPLVGPPQQMHIGPVQLLSNQTPFFQDSVSCQRHALHAVSPTPWTQPPSFVFSEPTDVLASHPNVGASPWIKNHMQSLSGTDVQSQAVPAFLTWPTSMGRPIRSAPLVDPQGWKWTETFHPPSFISESSTHEKKSLSIGMAQAIAPESFLPICHTHSKPTAATASDNNTSEKSPLSECTSNQLFSSSSLNRTSQNTGVVRAIKEEVCTTHPSNKRIKMDNTVQVVHLNEHLNNSTTESDNLKASTDIVTPQTTFEHLVTPQNLTAPKFSINAPDTSSLQIVYNEKSQLWLGYWIKPSGKRACVSFSVLKLGAEEAKNLAVKWYEKKLRAQSRAFRTLKKTRVKSSTLQDSEELHGKLLQDTDSKKIIQKSLNDLNYSEELKKPHVEYRAAYASLPPEGHPFGGVFMDSTSYTLSHFNAGKWIACWEVGGRQFQRSFLISKYGYRRAKELAESWRHEKVLRAIEAGSQTTGKHAASRDVVLIRSRGRPPKSRISNIVSPSSVQTTSNNSHMTELQSPDANNIILVDSSASSKIDVDHNFNPLVNYEMSNNEPPLSDTSTASVLASDHDVGIKYNSDEACWNVLDPLDESVCCEKIYEDKYGNEKAREMALQIRKEKEKAVVDYYFNTVSDLISFDKSRLVWKVSYSTLDKGRKTKHFSIRKYGWSNAKRLAFSFYQCAQAPGISETELNNFVYDGDEYDPPLLKRLLSNDCQSICAPFNVQDSQYQKKVHTSLLPTSLEKDSLNCAPKVIQQLDGEDDTCEHSVDLSVSRSDRRKCDPNHPTSTVKGVHYSKRENAWICRWSDSTLNKVIVKGFQVRVHGFEGAKTMAEEYRRQKEASGEAKTRGLSYSVPTIRFAQADPETGSAWQVVWSMLEGGQPKCFAVSTYGYEKAQELALEYKRQLESVYSNFLTRHTGSEINNIQTQPPERIKATAASESSEMVPQTCVNDSHGC